MLRRVLGKSRGGCWVVTARHAPTSIACLPAAPLIDGRRHPTTSEHAMTPAAPAPTSAIGAEPFGVGPPKAALSAAACAALTVSGNSTAAGEEGAGDAWNGGEPGVGCSLTRTVAKGSRGRQLMHWCGRASQRLGQHPCRHVDNTPRAGGPPLPCTHQ